MQFAHPQKVTDPKRPPNNGTLVLFLVPPSVTENMIRAEFEKFGDLRDLRTSGGNYFIEYWDIRDCEKAYRFGKTTKLFGMNVNVEYSRPGGFRKNPDAFLSSRKPVVSRVVKGAAPIITIESNHSRCPENEPPVVEFPQKSTPLVIWSVCRMPSN
jgi:RNA recognition motif-containing protein